MLLDPDKFGMHSSWFKKPSTCPSMIFPYYAAPSLPRGLLFELRSRCNMDMKAAPFEMR